MIPGGLSNDADGNYSLCAGRRAHAGGFAGTFVWGDSEDADFTADWANQFKVRASGGCKFVQNNPAAGYATINLEQTDVDEAIVHYIGTSAADQTKSISTVNGDGVVTGPKDFAASAGWAFVGMIKIAVNGVDYWMPYYQPDLA
jgi:hypothetical protein